MSLNHTAHNTRLNSSDKISWIYIDSTVNHTFRKALPYLFVLLFESNLTDRRLDNTLKQQENLTLECTI